MGEWLSENIVKIVGWAIFLPAIPFVMFKISQFVFQNDNEGSDGFRHGRWDQ